MNYSVTIADNHPFTAQAMETVIGAIDELSLIGKAL